MKKSVFHILIFLFLLQNLYSQPAPNGLTSYAEQNKKIFSSGMALYNSIQQQLKSEGFNDTEFSLSIIFPELLRYSEMADEIETITNKIIYRASPESEGFSIGYFQMKPIFAESIEIAIAKNSQLKNKYPEIDFSGTKNKRTERINRINRLRDLRTEYIYIQAFIEICTEKFDLTDENEETKIKLLATAYNSGFFYTRQQLERISQKNAYPFGSDDAESKWNYAQLCYDFYSLTKAE